MSESIGARERIGLRKRSRRERKARLRGRIVLERYRREPDGSCGSLIERTRPRHNVIQAAGIQAFYDLVANAGIHSANHFDGTNATLELRPTSDTGTVAVFAGTGGGGPASGTVTQPAPSAAMRWIFQDNTINQYDPDWAYLANKADGDETDGIYMSRIDISGFGSKPSTENWHYDFTLELYSADTDFTSLGLLRCLDLVAGLSSSHLDNSNTTLQPRDGGMTAIGSPIACSGGFPTITGGIKWKFESADTENEGAWVNTDVEGVSVNLRSGGCKQDGSSCGTKGPGEIWDYEYTMTVS